MSKIIENTINHIIDNYYSFFLSKENVVGIALGHKFIRGLNTKEPCLHVFVENKIPTNKLCKIDLIPIYFCGIKTDVIEHKIASMNSSNSTINSSDISKLKLFKRPIQPGYSIGRIYNTSAGTLGAIVFDNSTDEPCILSSNHVLINNKNSNESEISIVQPSFKDNKKLTDPVAYLYKTINEKPYNKSDPLAFNHIDCAIAKLYPDVEYIVDIYKLGKIRGIADAIIGMPIRKVGRTTGYTTGTITSINATKLTYMDDKTNLFLYKNQITSNLKSNSGDSGSIILDFYNRAVGLLMSSDGNNCTTINPIKPILQYLNVNFKI